MQRYFSKEKKDNTFILSNEDLYHIKTVMRMKEEFIEVVYNNSLYLCKLDKDYNVNIEKQIEQINNKKVKFILCIPLLQEQKMSFVLQKATELGVDYIVPFYAVRSKVKLDLKEDKKIIRWNKIVKEASEQSKRLDIPIISNVKKISELNFEGLKILCSTKEKINNIKNEIKNNLNYDTIVMVIGPEGGLSNLEEEQLNKIGFKSVSLGEQILRVETVPIYLLSILNYELME